MDWTSVYEDGGEEEGDWALPKLTSARTGMLASLREGYTPTICYLFTVNYILGVGCLGIPYAFLKSGVILGTLLVLGLSLVSFMTVSWVAEVSHKSLQLKIASKGNPFRSPSLVSRRSSSNLSSQVNTARETTSLMTSAQSMSDLYSSIAQLVVAVPQQTTKGGNIHKEHISTSGKQLDSMIPIRTRLRPERGGRNTNNSLLKENQLDGQDPGVQVMQEPEVTDLALEFLGPVGKACYQIALMLLTYTGLLAYTQVFIQSFQSQLWPGISSVLPVVLFSAVVVPLSCCDLSEQVAVQVGMSLLRFVSLAVMLFGTLGAIVWDQKDYAALKSTQLGVRYGPGASSSTPLFDISGFGIMFSTAVFSQLFQHSVPGLIRPLSESHKRQVPRIFCAALATTAFIYISTGCACVAFFGEATSQSVNLNFAGFYWGVDDDNVFAKPVLGALAMIVVLFPALDTLSVFPLIANTLGSSLHAALPTLPVGHIVMPFLSLLPVSLTLANGEASKQQRPTLSPESEGRAALHRATLLFWKLCASVPPILLSLFVQDLSFTLQLAGICGILVALIAPALLQKVSSERFDAFPASLSLTPYSSVFSRSIYIYVVLFVAFVALCISLYQMLYPMA